MKIGHIVIIALMILFTSCNKEVVNIKGKLKGYQNSTVELKLKTKSGKEKLLFAEIQVKDEKFDIDIIDLKPPFKFTLVLSDKREVDYWVFKYGVFSFNLDTNNLANSKINDSFENSELNRVKDLYDEMYLKPLQKQIEWIANYESNKQEQTDEAKLNRYKDQVKKAYRLRKKSILKTVRENPTSPIAIALMTQEYKRLTIHQKKEYLKYLGRNFSDTGLNWQMKN